MKPPSFIVHNCDVLEGLASLHDESINCCVTSPPYYGLRDYGVEGQIGLDVTPEDYIQKMVVVRAFGKDYGHEETGLENPATSLRGLIERKEAKKDIKAVRKIKYTLLNLMDDCDFDTGRKSRVLAEFADVFSGLEESFLHFTASM